jgi:CDGSH-type Zn-finger protein
MTAMTTAMHPSPLTLPAGTHALCTCGLSRNGAFCDGSHQGSGQSPHILKLDAEQTVYLCSCAASAKTPFCDGSHLQLSASTPQSQRPWWKVWG